eukprot:CAMPEP_0179214158 /NCGR_PEP_ID=MMETSP0797-20121207/2149_1 /TAXON_ID=47934 /ORGANISM="Dinophysis acuminata, Strain DAEP01" /LENGTH=188 /DNA_ID=CAMNT_0020920137 /DNA_START=628 /DNA_END=1190 /DNA_ORIENTATION=-
MKLRAKYRHPKNKSTGDITVVGDCDHEHQQVIRVHHTKHRKRRPNCLRLLKVGLCQELQLDPADDEGPHERQLSWRSSKCPECREQHEERSHPGYRAPEQFRGLAGVVADRLQLVEQRAGDHDDNEGIDKQEPEVLAHHREVEAPEPLHARLFRQQGEHRYDEGVQHRQRDGGQQALHHAQEPPWQVP